MSARLLPVLRVGPVSVIARRRAVVVSASCCALLLGMVALHLMRLGEAPGLADIVATFLGSPPDAQTELVVWNFRAPRTVAAVVVGSALGVSGALTQTMTRNPLASPDLLGIMSGAALGVVLTAVLSSGLSGGLTGTMAVLGAPTGAMVMGTVAAAFVVLLTHDLGLSTSRVVVVGLGVTGLCSALTSWALTVGDTYTASQAVTWMIGSLNGKDWETILGPTIGIGAGFLTVLVASHRLRPMIFSDETATSLGASARRGRLLMIVLATWLAVTATSLAGPVGFVALATPHIARMVTRHATPPLFTSGVLGAVLVTVADAVCANLFSTAMPVGIGTAVLGAPYLIFLLVRRKAI